MWTSLYFLVVEESIKDITREQDQIKVSLSTLYQQSLLVSEFTELVATNATVNVTNVPIDQDFLRRVLVLKNVNGIVDQFRDEDGDLTPQLQKVFFDFPCQDFLLSGGNEFTVESCYELSGGSGRTGFVRVTTQAYITMSDFYETFMSSPRTAADIWLMVSEIADTFETISVLAPQMCSILYSITSEQFDKGTNDQKTIASTVFWLTLVGLIIGGYCYWRRGMRRIFALQCHDKEVLQQVPIKVILNNRYIKSYLLRTSGAELAKIGRFLH